MILSDCMNIAGESFSVCKDIEKLMRWDYRGRECQGRRVSRQEMLIGRRGHKILRLVFSHWSEYFWPKWMSHEKISSDQKPVCFSSHIILGIVMTAHMHCMFFRLSACFFVFVPEEKIYLNILLFQRLIFCVCNFNC